MVKLLLLKRVIPLEVLLYIYTHYHLLMLYTQYMYTVMPSCRTQNTVTVTNETI